MTQNKGWVVLRLFLQNMTLYHLVGFLEWIKGMSFSSCPGNHQLFWMCHSLVSFVGYLGQLPFLAVLLSLGVWLYLETDVFIARGWTWGGKEKELISELKFPQWLDPRKFWVTLQKNPHPSVYFRERKTPRYPQFFKMSFGPDGVAQLVGALSCTLKRLWVQSPVGVSTGGNQSMFYSVSVIQQCTQRVPKGRQRPTRIP